MNFFFVSFLSFLIVSFYRNYARTNNILDIPNHRSSHISPIPRGGGIGIVTTVLLFLPFSGLEVSFICGLILSSLLVATVGFCDDLKGVSTLHRLLWHALAACCLLFALGGFPVAKIFGIQFNNILLNVFGVLFLIWMLNLFNFMDGIDGIATIEAITVSAGAALILFIKGGDGAIINFLLLISCASFGFLFWNFPKARIFMGDSGSSFLGFVLGGTAIYSEVISPGMFWVFLILLSVFIVDATLTLAVRALRRDRLYEAHRSHAYQNASRRLKSHVKVTLFVAGINLFYLLPLAVLVDSGKITGIMGVVFAYLPLSIFALILKAGSSSKFINYN